MGVEKCDEHSGVCKGISSLEDQMKIIWGKIDTINKCLIGALVTLVLNLIGVITILLRS